MQIFLCIVARGRIFRHKGGGEKIGLQLRGVPDLTDEGSQRGLVARGVTRGKFQNERIALARREPDSVAGAKTPAQGETIHDFAGSQGGRHAQGLFACLVRRAGFQHLQARRRGIIARFVRSPFASLGGDANRHHALR